MASFNKVILIGNLTRDPELRVTANGNSICKIGIAVNRTFMTRDGERREETTFIDIDAFGKQAEVIGKYLSKGRPLMVEGRLKLDQWESEGQKRSRLGVVLENFQFLSPREDTGGGYSRGNFDQSSPQPRPPASITPHEIPSPGVNRDFSNDADTLDEDVPF